MSEADGVGRADGVDVEAIRAVLHDAGESPPAGPLAATAIPGGASRDLWAVGPDGGPPRYVLRRDPPGEVPQTSRAVEWAIQSAAQAAGVPVPRPIAFEPAGGRFETAGLLMDWVDGEALPKRVLRAGTLRATQLGAALRALRAVDVAALPLDVPDDACATALAEVRATLEETGDILPALELALRWLELHRPDPVAPGVVHGDFRLANFLVGPQGLAAVVDWEFAHAGDPAEDLAWACARPWRFGADDRPAAGVGSVAELLDGFGEPVAPERLRWWDVLSQVKWGAYCARQAFLRRTGAHASLERTVLARRVAEAEWDALELLR